MSIAQTKSEQTKDKRKWYFTCYYTNFLGERKKYKSKKYLSKEEAILEEAKFLISKGERKVNSFNFDEIFDEYIIKQQTKVRSITINKIKGLYSHIKPHLGRIKIKDLTLLKYKQWYNHINSTNYCTEYKNKLYRLIITLLKYSNDFYNITSNIPFRMGRFVNPNESKKEMRFLTYEEFLKFIEKEKDRVYNALFTTLYHMGLRQGEATGLLFSDIDFTTNKIKIWKTFTTKTQKHLERHPKEALYIVELSGKKFYFSPPKTKSSARELTMPNAVRTALLDLKTFYETLPGFKASCFVFGMARPLSETMIQKRKNNACDKAKLSVKEIVDNKAKLKRIRIHDFRHSFASLMINNGANITIVSKYLGHSDISQTLNTYSHMFPSKQEEIIKIIDNLQPLE